MATEVGSFSVTVETKGDSDVFLRQHLLNVKNALKAMADATLQRAQMLRADGAGNAVPYKTGALQSTGIVEPKGEYEQIVQFGNGLDYARYQEFGQRADGSHVVRNYTTPGTGAHYLRDAGNSVKQEGIKNYL